MLVRVTHIGQILSQMPGKHPGPPRWGFVVGLASRCKENVSKPWQWEVMV